MGSDAWARLVWVAEGVVQVGGFVLGLSAVLRGVAGQQSLRAPALHGRDSGSSRQEDVPLFMFDSALDARFHVCECACVETRVLSDDTSLVAAGARLVTPPCHLYPGQHAAERQCINSLLLTLCALLSRVAARWGSAHVASRAMYVADPSPTGERLLAACLGASCCVNAAWAVAASM